MLRLDQQQCRQVSHLCTFWFGSHESYRDYHPSQRGTAQCPTPWLLSVKPTTNENGKIGRLAATFLSQSFLKQVTHTGNVERNAHAQK
jgi:hypothetical protein